MRLAVIVDERDHGLEPAVELRLGKIRGGLAQDLIGRVGLPQLPVLSLQGFQLLGDLGGKAGADAAIHLRLLHPLIERLRRAADLAAIEDTTAQRDG